MIHSKTGWYLARPHVSQAVGVTEYSILHVQGHHTTSYHMRDEEATIVVALMRGGEPMAFDEIFV